MPLGPVLEGLLGPQLTAALGGAMMAAGTFLASYAANLRAFVWSYAVLFGLGVGITYQAPSIHYVMHYVTHDVTHHVMHDVLRPPPPGLHPPIVGTATRCTPGCNPMYSRLQPSL